MADTHGDNDLRRLEREAEAARARLHETIAEIKDPRTIDNAKLEMKHRAEEVKDQIVDYIKGAKENALESGRQQGNEFSRKLQRTAIENPLSVALIGAGIGWHLYKKPPITTALIGAGIWQLMKSWDNSPNDAAFRDPYNRLSPRGYVPGGVAGYGYDEVTDVASATDRVKNIATNLSYGAQDAVAGVQDAISGATERVRDVVSQGVDTVRGASAQAADTLRSTSAQAADTMRTTSAHAADDMSRLGASMSDRASAQYQSATSRVSDLAQDATGAMRGVADEAQRRLQPVVDRISPWLDEQHRGQLGMVMVLGGIGVLAGGWLRGSETGRRWMSEARDRLDESWSSVQDNARDMSKRASVEDWRDDASSTMSRVSDQAASLRRSAMENAGELRDRGAATMRSAQELGSEHPLLLSAIGLAIGAVLGGMIRQTPFERDSFGAMAGNLRDRAVDTLQENMGNLADRASDVAQAVVGAVTGDDKNDPAKKAQAQRDRVNA
jgi:ElaB/YqjD/DUF883 family membrane-anchored ribosome-binding protein